MRKLLYKSLLLILPATALAGLLTQSAGSGAGAVSGDSTPAQFTFTDQTDVALSSTITSAPVTLTGIDTVTPCTVSNGTIDVNSSGSFASSQNYSNNDTLRVRQTSSASNSTATNSPVDCNGVTDTFTSTTLAASGSGVFFAPNIDTWTGGVTGAGKFDDQNNSPTAVIDTTVFRPGHSKSIRLDYTADEDGTDLILLGTSQGGQFPSTTTLFVRTYEYFDGAWSGNWPQGLKTGRFFTRPDGVSCGDDPYNVPYVSEKIIYPGYETSPDPRIQAYVTNGSWAYCNRFGAIPDEFGGTYDSADVFANGLPYIRTGVWYKFERWYVMNSGNDVADGVIRLWIDDQEVVNLTNIPFRSVTRDTANTANGYGTTWMSGWIGGNYSNTGTFTGGTKHRYISDPYFSTTLDR